MADAVKIAIIGAGPAGLSAAAHAATLGVSHRLIEASPQISNTIFRYQRGKHVMAEPGVLPLRSPLRFEAGTRERILDHWQHDLERCGTTLQTGAEVTAISGEQGAFRVQLQGGAELVAEYVVLAIGMQGNLRKLGLDGEAQAPIQYQLDDPDEYHREKIIVVGAGDAAIENALALAPHNKVTIINRRDHFDRAKPANNEAILAAIEAGNLSCIYNATPTTIAGDQDSGYKLLVKTDGGESEPGFDRVIARLGAIPPRRFVESCGIEFPDKDLSALPELSATYESNVRGLYVIGALAGFPLIKQAMNQGYEVIEAIEGRECAPADEPLLQEKFADVPGWDNVNQALEDIRNAVPMMAPLTPLQLREFLLDSTVHTPAAGDVVFKRNDYTNSFYSIVSGAVSVSAPGLDQEIRIGAGDFFGEMGLISGRRRTATITATEPCVLIESPRRTTNKLINSVPAIRRLLDQTFLKRAIQSQIAPDVPDDALGALADSATLESFDSGQELFHEGDPGDSLHLIRKGSVTISREIGGREVVLSYVPAGQYIGEMALISELPRSATARAAVRVETINLKSEPFRALLAKYPSVRKRVEAVYKKRMSSNASARRDANDGSVLSFLMEQGLGEATDVLLIDESLCVRCDQCETACAATHGQLSRLDREAGASYAHLHVPTSCRHCEHPHCMKDCPPDAIRRSPGGEVYITDACIGCGNCERNCPYGVIQMGVEKPAPSLWSWLLFGLGDEPGRSNNSAGKSGQQKKATKCDMCKDLPAGPACVRACPTGAAQRVRPEAFLQIYKRD